VPYSSLWEGGLEREGAGPLSTERNWVKCRQVWTSLHLPEPWFSDVLAAGWL
jgi:hypothetical protein